MIAQILLAEDNPDIAAMLGEYLLSRGHRLLKASNGFELAQKAVEHRPHLIITDIQMPGTYGSSAYLVLQKDPTTKDIPVIFISAHAPEKVLPLLPKDDPKTRFMNKPIDLPKLDEYIAELLPLGGYAP